MQASSGASQMTRKYTTSVSNNCSWFTHWQLQDIGQHFFFSGMPLMECCRIDDASPENTIVGLPSSWVDTGVSRLYIDINPPQPGGMQVPSRSPAVSWWSERRTDRLTARWWSCLESERATWPKKRSVLVLMTLETGGQPGQHWRPTTVGIRKRRPTLTVSVVTINNTCDAAFSLQTLLTYLSWTDGRGTGQTVQIGSHDLDL